MGYQTSGSFSVDAIESLSEEVAVPLAPVYKLTCTGTKLDAKDVTLTSDPFIEITSKKGNRPRKIYRSEVIPKNLNPEWLSFDLVVDEIGGVDATFTITCYDFDENGSHDSILSSFIYNSL